MLRPNLRQGALLALAPLLVAPLSAAPAGAGGGDVPYDFLVCTNPFEDISQTGMPLNLGDDENAVLPIFGFRYWGAQYNEVSVCSNGFVQFGAEDTDYQNVPIPNAADPNNIVCPLWDDLNPEQGGQIYVQTLGSSPNRRFIAQWDAVEHNDVAGLAATFQVVLYEGSNNIEFHYGPLMKESPTIGIENNDGTLGIAVVPISVAQGVCILFSSMESSTTTDLNCQEFDRFEDLTPNDTLTVFTKNHNPQQEQGYLCAYAVDASNRPVAFDWLAGSLLVISGIEVFQYQVNPVDYLAAGEQGALTDVDADGVRDLDGNEYERTAGEILVPRFLGVDSIRGTEGELILLDLEAGAHFDTTVGFLVYNDDEDQFSAQHEFRCWDKVPLRDISNVFTNFWLTNFSGQSELESLGNLEYGWFRMFGQVASSTAVSILDPAVYAVYVERVGSYAAADLPFERCTQDGHLLPRSVTGDNSLSGGGEGVGGGGQDCEDRHSGRRPASLLVFPEFDNRAGLVTLATVTNVNRLQGTRVHYVYVGRFSN